MKSHLISENSKLERPTKLRRISTSLPLLYCKAYWKSISCHFFPSVECYIINLAWDWRKSIIFINVRQTKPLYVRLEHEKMWNKKFFYVARKRKTKGDWEEIKFQPYVRPSAILCWTIMNVPFTDSCQQRTSSPELFFLTFRRMPIYIIKYLPPNIYFILLQTKTRCFEWNLNITI